MKKQDYINLLISNYIDNKTFFKDFILRCLYKYKNELLISNYEFLTRSIKILDEVIVNVKKEHNSLIQELESNYQKYKDTKESVYHERRLNEVRELKDLPYFYKIPLEFNFGVENEKILTSDIKEIIIILKNLFDDHIAKYPEKNLDKDEIIKLMEFNNKVFKNQLSQKLFETYVNDYKNHNNEQAYFSFLYDALKRLNLIHCSGSVFIKELQSYSVTIERIDTNQCYEPSNNKFIPFKYLYKSVFGEFPK